MKQDFDTAPSAKLIMPNPVLAAKRFQGMGPEQILETIDLDSAQQIFDEWTTARSSEALAKANLNSINTYNNNGIMLEAKYSTEYNINYTDLSPVDFVKAFFRHSRHLSKNTYKLYRFSLLHFFNERLNALSGSPQPSLVKALATLIVCNSYPFSKTIPNAEIRISEHQARVKSLSAARFDTLISHLATGYAAQNKTAIHTQSMAIATMATGLRPTEWKNTQVREATSAEVPAGANPDQWLALTVKTAKRKSNDKDWFRTLIIPPGVQQIHIRQHLKNIQSLRKPDEEGEEAADIDKNFNKKCSETLSKACKALWPDKPQTWIDMYSLRSQARANLTAVHGKFVAAAMLGHSIEKSEDFYAGSHRANLPRTDRDKLAVPRPGADVIAKAQEFQNQASRRTLMRLERVKSINDQVQNNLSVP